MKNLLSALHRLPSPLLAALACLSILPVLTNAYDGVRLVQVVVLSLSAWLLLWWRHPHKLVRRLQISGAAALSLAFLLDGAARGFILRSYGAAPDSTMVTTALANTTSFEAKEFVLAYGAQMGQWGLALLFSLFWVGVFLAAWWQQPNSRSSMRTWQRVGFVLLLLTLGVALTLRPWRVLHPLVFWPKWGASIAELRTQWQTTELQRESLRQRAWEQAPALTSGSPDTLVLVMSDSVNRNHLSVYGYPRPTTPNFEERLKTEPDQLKIFRHAWSVDASTVPALQNFFYFGERRQQDRDHLLSLAAAAGYKTWWISNHDDLAVFQEHSKLADHSIMLNNVPGRSTTSFDEKILPPLEAALRESHERKLIVVHLLGAHPHYPYRYPSDHARFRGVKDLVYQALKDKGRSFWTLESRNDYDSAIHFHDTVVDGTLELTRRFGKNASWVYLSDHGQEVGSVSDHSGHSAASPDGYRIPLMVWGGAAKYLGKEMEVAPVRADWLGHSLIRMLGISWKGYRANQDFTNPDYRWHPPRFPFSVDFYS